MTTPIRYQPIQSIGNGKQGSVSLCMDTVTKNQVAVKTIQKTKDFKKLLELEREKNALTKLKNNRYVIQLLDVVEDEKEVKLITEYDSNLISLWDYHSKRDKASFPIHPLDLSQIFFKIIRGVMKCREQNIVHRDLKPHNILIHQQTKEIKLIDFGLAREIPKNKLVSTRCGTPFYMAPEIVKGELYNPKRSEIWTLGVCLYFLSTGTTPFISSSAPELFKKIVAGKFTIPEEVDPAISDLIRTMLKVNPDDRPHLHQIIKHSFFCSDPLQASSQCYFNRFSLEQVMKMFSQIIEALQYCNKRDATHRQIDLANMVINPHTKEIRLINFSSLAGAPNESIGKESPYEYGALTPDFCSPEVVAGLESNEKSDIWSLGICLYYLLSGKLPFSGNITQRINQIKNGEYTLGSIDLEMKEFIEFMLRADVEKRPTLEEVVNHPIWNQFSVDKENHFTENK